MLKSMKKKSIFEPFIIIAVWLLLWQIVSMQTGLDLLLAGPVDVFMALWKLVQTRTFYVAAGYSFLKITIGFLTAFGLACILGFLSGRFRLLEAFLRPPVQVMKALPAASFIILLLIWFGSANVAVWIAAIVVFPVIYTAVIEGMHQRDRRLLEMAAVFRIPEQRKLRCVVFPQLMPFLAAGLQSSLGLCWKAGVSAEVIGLVRGSIGEQLYFAKIYLLTADLFAWSLLVVLLSVLFEKVFLLLLQKLAAVLGRV